MQNEATKPREILRLQNELSLNWAQLASLGLGFEQKMFVELGGESGLWAVHLFHISVIHLIDDTIGAVLKTAKFARSTPVAGEEYMKDT